VNKKIIFLLAISITSFIFGQSTGKISGTITDKKGEPLISANVVVQGSTMGAATGQDGSYYIINVPPGIYTLTISSMGFISEKIQEVEIRSGLTTKINASLSPTTLNMGEVVVSYTRPPIQKDLTSKMQGFETGDIQNLPINGSLSNLLTRQAGISADIVTVPVLAQPIFGLFATVPNDGLHFRGGRTNETAYMFDGITVTDELWGGFNFDVIGSSTIQSMETLTGTFGPQFGNAMSGVLLLDPIDNVPEKIVAKLSVYSDGTNKIISSSMNTYNFDGSISGPIFGLKNMGFIISGKEYSTDGYLFGYIYPDYMDSGGLDKTGTPQKVPMAFRDSRSIFGKFIWQVSDDIKFRIGYLNTSEQQGNYNHYFKYNPNGTPHVHLDGNLIYAKFTQLLSKSTFYNFSMSYYQRNFKSHVYDDSATYAIRTETGTGEFSISGEDYVYIKSNFNRLEGKFDITSQITKQQNINLGISASRLSTTMLRLNPTGFYAIENYDYKPYEGNAFINDKMEFDDIGMVINIGARVDYINTNRDYLSDITQPTGGISRSKPFINFSPRFGVSYPISDVAAFRFGYGYYYQYPALYEVYEGANRNYSGYPAPDITETMGTVSKGNLQPEKTINYEAGVQLAITPLLTLDVTGFYRKISNLIGITVVHGYLYSGGAVKQQNYSSFDNVNFATVKGIEVSLNKRFSNCFSGFLNYTYTQALVSSSLIFSLPTDVSRTFPADWDQPHVISFGAIFSFPGDWGFSLLGNLSSGLPYTYNSFQTNALRATFLSDVDLRVNKRFNIFGVVTEVYLQISNLLNRPNVYWVYPSSGRPGQGTDPAYSNDYYNNPSEWGPQRNIMLGLSLSY
jgi:hypothetical protein